MKRRWLVRFCLLVGVLVWMCGCTTDDDQAPLYQDEFGDADSGWGAGEGKNFKRGYEDDAYFIELEKSDWFIWAYPGQQFDDVDIEVQAYLASGSSTDGHEQKIDGFGEDRL